MLPGANVQSIVLLGLAYVAVRWIEAWGLWNDKAWGEVLGAVSGAIYVPFELTHLLERPSWISAGVLLSNVALVVYLVWVLLRRRKAEAAARYAALNSAGAGRHANCVVCLSGPSHCPEAGP